MAFADAQTAGPSTTGSATVEPRAPRPNYQPNPDDKAIVDRVTTRITYSNREASRWALERQIFENHAFYLGIHWLEFTEGSRAPTRWKAPSWLPTPVTNGIAPRVKKMVAALLRTEPQGRVRPNTNDPEDREAAKVAEKLVGHFYDVTDEDALRQKGAIIAALGGTLIAEDYWNPRAGKLLEIPRQTLVDTPATEPAATCDTCGTTLDQTQVGVPCPTCQQPLGLGERPRLLPDGTPATETQLQPELDVIGQPVVD